MLEHFEVVSLLQPENQDVERAGTASFSVATPVFRSEYVSLGCCTGVTFLLRVRCDGWMDREGTHRCERER